MSLNNRDIYQGVLLTIDVSKITNCKPSSQWNAVSHSLVMKRFISACKSQVKRVRCEDKADQDAGHIMKRKGIGNTVIKTRLLFLTHRST
jgi:hypothetical protein